MGPLRKMLGLIDAAARAEFKAEKMFKDKEYTPEQQDMLDFYEPACRIWCRNQGKDPDQMCDVLEEGKGLTGLPELYRVPAWHLVVDMCHEVYRAIGEATAQYQQAQAAAQAMGLHDYPCPACGSLERLSVGSGDGFTHHCRCGHCWNITSETGSSAQEAGPAVAH